MTNPTVPELNEALCYLDRTATIIKSMAIPQISPPRSQSLAMQNLFRDKLDHFCDRLTLFLSIDKEFNQQVLLAWLDTIMDIRKQMWDGYVLPGLLEPPLRYLQRRGSYFGGECIVNLSYSLTFT